MRDAILQINDIRRKVIGRFDTLSQFQYVKEEDRKSILLYKPILLELLSKIRDKIRDGKCKPWKVLNLEEKNKKKMENTKVSVGIFGGSFDPPHIVHLLRILSHLANDESRSDFIVVLPSANPDTQIDPLRPSKNPYELRAKLLKFMIADFGPLIRLSNVRKNNQFHHAIENLIIINWEVKISITQIMGSDNFKRVHKKIPQAVKDWKKFSKNIIYRLHVFQRAGGMSVDEMNAIGFQLPLIIEPPLSFRNIGNISSTLVREDISLKYFYPHPEVLNLFIGSYVYPKKIRQATLLEVNSFSNSKMGKL